jgi:hypothetical protein
MSWDAVILKVQGPFRPIEEVADEDYLPLGSIEAVAERIRASFPNAEWSSATWATWGLDGDTGVTIDLEGVESSNSILVSVSGSGNPVPHLLALARTNDWVVLDCSTTEFINPDEGSSEGWEGYQSLMSELPEPTPGSEVQPPPQAPPLTPPEAAPQAAPQTAPQTARPAAPKTRKKKKAAKKAGRKVMRKGAAKKSRPGKNRPKTTKKPSVKKRAKPKKRPKVKSSARKKKPKKKK